MYNGLESVLSTTKPSMEAQACIPRVEGQKLECPQLLNELEASLNDLGPVSKTKRAYLKHHIHFLGHQLNETAHNNSSIYVLHHFL